MNTKYSVLDSFKRNPFAENQNIICANVEFFRVSSSLRLLCLCINVVSSANTILEVGILNIRSLIAIRNKIGPKPIYIIPELQPMAIYGMMIEMVMAQLLE